MNTNKCVIFITIAAVLLLTGCANSRELQKQREAKQADIDAILSVELDPAEFGERERCLGDHEYRSFRPLDSKHVLFEGRGDKLWINTLRSSCIDYRPGDVLVVQHLSSTRLCDADRFEATDWFSWSSFSRMHPHSRQNLVSGPTCVLGTFQPVTKAQVDEIEAIIRND